MVKTTVIDLNSPTSLVVQRLQYAHRFIRHSINITGNTSQWLETEFDDFNCELSSVGNYPPTQGTSLLIEAICHREFSKYHLKVDPSEALVTNGALHGLSLIFRSLYRPGAVALCQAPVFWCIAELLQTCGYRVEYFSLENNQIDGSSLQEKITENVQVIFVNTPNNPTGEILSKDCFRKLLQLTQSCQASLIADLVYDEFVFEKNQLIQPLSLQGIWQNLYVVNSMSKNFAAPGLRVGWIISSSDNIQSLTALLTEECLGICYPAQQQALTILKRGNQSLVERVVKNRETVDAVLSQMSEIAFEQPAGGLQYFVKLPVQDIEDFADFMLTEFGLVLVTSGTFRACPDGYVRIPLGYPTETILQGIELLKKGLQKWN